jgi:tetratricopeptide (TPR) repeat protein
MSEPLAYAFDQDTLHEVYADVAAVAVRIEDLRRDVRRAPDDIAELLARGELVNLLRGAGRLDEALAEGRRAVERAEVIGTPPQQHTARTRLAHVHQWRGEFAESNLLFTELLAAASQFGPVIEAFTHQHAGKNDYDQGHWADARDHFARALRIREELDLPEEQQASSRLALAAAERRLSDSEEPT